MHKCWLTPDIQSLHNFTLYSGILLDVPILRRHFLVFAGLLAPCIFVAPTAAFAWSTYTSSNTCWVDYSQMNAYIELGPIVLLTLLAVGLNGLAAVRPMVQIYTPIM
jgi:hypothetical protein